MRQGFALQCFSLLHITLLRSCLTSQGFIYRPIRECMEVSITLSFRIIAKRELYVHVCVCVCVVVLVL